MPQPFGIQSIPAADRFIAQNDDEAVEQVACCLKRRQPLCHYGAGYEFFGHPPSAGFAAIEPPSDILNHWQNDMTVRVGAGMTMHRLQEELARQNQWLPVDGGNAGWSVGEWLSMDVSGSLKQGCGSWRDLLLGLNLIDGQARLLKPGGQTVKNVAGYDLHRLQIGAFDTLGLITQLTLRTQPLPEVFRNIHIDGADSAAFENTLTDLMCSDAAPVALIWHGYPDNGFFELSYSGTEQTTGLLENGLKDWLKAHHPAARLNSTCLSWQMDLDRRFKEAHARHAPPTRFRLRVPPGHGAAALKRLSTLLTPDSHLQWLPAFGELQASGTWDISTCRAIHQTLNDLLTTTPAGHCIWTKKPPELTDLPWLHPDPFSLPVNQAVKKALDPHNLFNPGRFTRIEKTGDQT